MDNVLAGEIPVPEHQRVHRGKKSDCQACLSTVPGSARQRILVARNAGWHFVPMISAGTYGTVIISCKMTSFNV
jgi:hypothetical protein